MTKRHIILAVLAALIWGATFPVTEAALQTTPPLLFAALRFSCAAVFVLVVPFPKASWLALIAAGLLLGAGQYGFLFVAMANGVPPGLASLLVHTQAFFTIIIALLVFREGVNLRQLVAIGLAVAGLGLLAMERDEGTTLFGLALVLVAALCGAAGNNVLKSLSKADMLGVAVWMSLAPPLPLLGLSAAFEGPQGLLENLANIGWVALAALAYSALLATVAAFAIWGRLLASYPASQVAPFFLLVPVFGIGLSVLLLGESFSAGKVMGSLLIFGGLLLAMLRPKLAGFEAQR